MPTPMEYKLATQDFDRFLADVATETNLGSRHQAYTTTQAVFLCFRRRLTLPQAIAFAQILPAMLRALFVNHWDANEAQADSWDCDLMRAEVKQLRVNHNFSPDTAIQDVARVLRTYVEARELDRCLETLPASARDFWSGITPLAQTPPHTAPA